VVTEVKFHTESVVTAENQRGWGVGGVAMVQSGARWCKRGERISNIFIA